jgi:hypothetical protein
MRSVRMVLTDMTGIEFTPYIRKPYRVDALKVTGNNIHVVAELIEGTVETAQDGKTFIRTHRKVVKNVDNIWPGFFLTKVRKKTLAYPSRLFYRNYVEPTEDVEDFVVFLEKLGSPED